MKHFYVAVLLYMHTYTFNCCYHFWYYFIPLLSRSGFCNDSPLGWFISIPFAWFNATILEDYTLSYNLPCFLTSSPLDNKRTESSKIQRRYNLLLVIELRRIILHYFSLLDHSIIFHSFSPFYHSSDWGVI